MIVVPLWDVVQRPLYYFGPSVQRSRGSLKYGFLLKIDLLYFIKMELQVMEIKFGYLLNSSELKVGAVRIKPLPEFDRIVDGYKDYCENGDGWFYPPLTKTQPKRTSQYFKLMPTHSAETTDMASDDHYIRYLILAYGFMYGVYLLPENYLYFNRTPYELRKLNHLVALPGDIELGMCKMSEIYLNSNFYRRKRLFSVVHWFLLSQTYRMKWEFFENQYKVIDCIYGLTFENMNKIPHSNRPVKLAEKYEIEVPDWAIIEDDKTSRLSRIRNELIHEAMFDGEPIGYALPKENFKLEFAAFNLKLICGLMGLNTPFMKTGPKSRNPGAWALSKK